MSTMCSLVVNRGVRGVWISSGEFFETMAGGEASVMVFISRGVSSRGGMGCLKCLGLLGLGMRGVC